MLHPLVRVCAGAFVCVFRVFFRVCVCVYVCARVRVFSHSPLTNSSEALRRVAIAPFNHSTVAGSVAKRRACVLNEHDHDVYTYS